MSHRGEEARHLTLSSCSVGALQDLFERGGDKVQGGLAVNKRQMCLTLIYIYSCDARCDLQLKPLTDVNVHRRLWRSFALVSRS